MSTRGVDPHLAVDAVIAVCGHGSYLIAGVYILHVHALHKADILSQRCTGIPYWLRYCQHNPRYLQEHNVLQVLQVTMIQALQDELRV